MKRIVLKENKVSIEPGDILVTCCNDYLVLENTDAYGLTLLKPDSMVCEEYESIEELETDNCIIRVIKPNSYEIREI